uniref:Delta/notch-like EGF repeat containing n=1 Tax=Cyprinus carpio TaxID=7962 RepID=A0A8C1MTT8_CYPCA
MQGYILPLLLILGVRDGLGTPLTSSPVPTEAPSLPPDPCEGRPCLNGGICSHVGEMEESPSTQMQADFWAYTCICGQGFTGQNCEFFADPCASSPCLHGNCSKEGEGDGFVCECIEGYSGVRCDLPTLTFDLSESTWDLAESLVPEHATPATPATPATTTQVFQPTTVPTTTQAPPTLESWQPKLGQKVVEILWKDQQVSRCAFACIKCVFVVIYKVGVLHVGSPSGPEVTLRLHLNVKTNNCVEPGSGFSDPQCSGKGKCITHSSVDTFYCQCDDGYSGIFCEEFDACHLKPCENNGTCADLRQRDEGQNYTCTCQPGFEGDRCQSLVDHCVSGPCRNGATCSSSLEGPHCYCAEGYQGAMCEQKIDPCASGPCHNNASCSPQGAGFSFSCICPAGFTGPTCAQLVDFCALNPCAHGICRSVGTSYRCLCVPGYHGLYCEEEYNECLSAPCQNYATCRDLINAYECICAPQFTGKHCEIYKDPCLRLRCQNGGRCESGGRNTSCVCPPGYMGDNCEVDVNECESNPCHHGGTCIDQSNGYTCHCPPGWVGGSCEIHLQWKMAQPVDSLTNMPRHSLYIIIGALCVAFVLMLIILIVGICRISRIEYQGSSRHAYHEFYNCRSIDSDFSNAIASIRHARFGKKSRPAMYDATPISYEDYSPDDKPLVTLIKTKDL